MSSRSLSESRLKDLLANTLDIASLYDRRLRLTHFGSQFKKQYGGVAEIGSPIWDIYPIFRDPVLLQELERISGGGAAIELTLPPSSTSSASSARIFAAADGIGVIEVAESVALGSMDAKTDVDHHTLLHQATHDILTGLQNRRQFGDRLQAALSDARGSDDKVALLQIDLDGFKAVNDTLGHDVGDALLQLVANRIQIALGDGETAFRNAGDEFTVIQTGREQPASADRLAKAILDLVKARYIISDVPVFVGASIGISVAPDHGASTDEMIKAADVALYAAKKDGRGCSRVYDRSMMLLLEERENLRRDLAMALQRGQFHLQYQPIVHPSLALTGFEALLSWRHPKLGLIPPRVFIPVAEADGHMDQIGKWVLEEACKQALTWPPNLSVAVNLSPAQFLSGTITDTVAQILDRTGIQAERLDLEITETILLETTVDNIDTLNTLNVLGVKVSLDDFGTYYSSLSYLKTFPFDIMKIDKYFIEDVETSSKSKAIVRNIINLAHSLGISVTAEGVETAGQAEWLREQGCDRLQGYFIARPMAPRAAHAFIERATRNRTSNTEEVNLDVRTQGAQM
tara:strand:- start:6607 stop:8328 length:1722 start_codon:yes stop_codon:yes gene_type:complete